MKKFKPNALTLALMLGGITVAGMPTYAQEDATSEAESDVEVIEVKGFRRSLIESLNTKRYSDTVVEAVSADDMGALPDVSIADAISRLPGVTSVRQGGQSSELNIRGLSGNYVFATMNGREMVSDQGGRSVQFDQYPSELINSVQVYKSQKASLIEGGVAGTIELQTANPLENSEDNTFTLQTKLSYNDSAEDHPDADAMGNRVSFSYQGKFLDETLGFAIGYARLQQPKISTQFVNYQPECAVLPYDGFAVTSDVDCNGDASEDGSGFKRYFIPSGFELMARGGEEVRDGLMSTITFLPTDRLQAKVDMFYTKFDSEAFDRGYRVGGWGAIKDGAKFDFQQAILGGENNDVILGATYFGDALGTNTNAPLPGGRVPFEFQTQSDNATIDSETFSIAGNLTYEGDDFTLSADFSHSRGESIAYDGVMRLALFNENTVTALDANDNEVQVPVAKDDYVISYELNGLDLPSISLDADTVAALSNPDRAFVTSLEKYPNSEENEATSFKVDFKYLLDNDFVSSIDTGFRIAERTHDFTRKMYRYGLDTDFIARRGGKWISSWDLTDPNNPKIDESFPPYQLSSGEYKVVNLGGDFAQYGNFLSIDNAYIENAWLTSQGVNTAPGQSWDNAWSIFESNKVTEQVMAAFVQANIDTEFLSMPLTGNIGVRVVNTDQSSTGLQLPADASDAVCITDDFGKEDCSYAQVEQGVDYTDVLPSLNLNLQLTENDQLRFAAAKVMARAEMPDMRVSGTWSYGTEDSTGIRYADFNATTSPSLKPFYATQYDLSYEHYFEETEGAIVFAVFYKDIESIVQQFTAEDFDFDSVGIVTPDVDEDGLPVTPRDYSAKFNNGEGGYLRGVEVAYTQTFSFLPGILEGLGFAGNYSFTESELTNDFTAISGQESVTSPLPGLSESVWTAALFFDYDEVFSTRINARYRDQYVGDQIAVGQNQQAYFNEELIIDYQASYQFTEELQGVFSVNNLTDEPNVSYFGEKYLTGTLQYFGRQFYFGLNAKF
ncbi:MAG: TonB-dependent receptor [Gammaproteobacteria bacterium]|nr:TonB-dependent receptor [Gammaproteobacteria bacterium]